MEKNSLGRGLEEISKIFLSTTRKEGQKPAHGFSAVTKRDETCASCVNMIEGSSREAKCKIFTLENEKYGVPHLDTITLNYANYCEHFEPETAAGTKIPSTGLLDQTTEECEIEEAVTIQKKIAYPDTETAQKDMEKVLLKYLKAGYRLNSIELKKNDELATPQGKETRKEEIIIFIKKSPLRP